MFWYQGIVLVKRTAIQLARETLPNHSLTLRVLETDNFKKYRDKFMTAGNSYLGITVDQMDEIVDIIIKDTLENDIVHSK